MRLSHSSEASGKREQSKSIIAFLERFFHAMEPAFSRKATFTWFVVSFVGLAVRYDTYGVTSVVRALGLASACYPCLLHFFHSSAWSVGSLLRCWWWWLGCEKVACEVNGRTVLLGDHTKTPKDGRRIPAVTTLHQDSETSSKPSYFRGHHWACLGILVNAGRKYFATPVWAEIHHDGLKESRATRIVNCAARIAHYMNKNAYLVLDAFFAVGPVFETAMRYNGTLHILTRAKRNVVAFRVPPKPRNPKRGRPRMYGRKVRLYKLFDTCRDKFETTRAQVHDKQEDVRFLRLDLMWKPVRGRLRFILVESSRGRMILMTSDLAMSPVVAVEMYCRRVTIETLFDVLKNVLGGMGYHFWSSYLKPASRRPTKNSEQKHRSSRPAKTKNTLAAIDKFVHTHLLVVGMLQMTSRSLGHAVRATAHCWLRTPTGDTPSEFITRIALANLFREIKHESKKSWIVGLIASVRERYAFSDTCEEAA